jgi:hypothetical protein
VRREIIPEKKFMVTSFISWLTDRPILSIINLEPSLSSIPEP